MTDEAKTLVARLREVGRDGVWKSGRNPATAHPMCIEAADLIETQAREIERLNTILSAMNDTDVIARTMAENERLREALVKATDCSELAAIQIARATIVGRAALAGDSHD